MPWLHDPFEELMFRFTNDLPSLVLTKVIFAEMVKYTRLNTGSRQAWL